MNKRLLLIPALGFAIMLAHLLSAPAKDRGPWVDPLLEPLVDEWIQDMDRAGIAYQRAWNRMDSVLLRPSPPGTVAHVKGRRHVVIDPSLVEKGPYSLRGALYHELGHAVFNLSHHGNGIMHAGLLKEADYAHHWGTYHQEYLRTCSWNRHEAW
jgi:hypothetical protein